MDIKELSIEFTTLKTEKEKIDFSLSLIELGVISVDQNISDVKLIFGKEYVDLGNRGIIYFRSTVNDSIITGVKSHLSPSSNSIRPSAITEGWYLIFFYDSNNIIQYYYLSNLHKIDASCLKNI